MSTRCAGAHGFSLVEVLVALALLTGAVVTLAHVMAATASTNAAARRATLATLLATDKLEQLRALPLDDEALAGSGSDTLAEDRDGFCDDPAPGYRRRWSIVPFPALPPGAAVVIAVAVSWGAGPPQAILTTLKVRRAI